MESRSQFGSYDGVQLSHLNCWSLSITRWIQSHWKEDNQEPYPQEVYDHFRPDEKAENALLHFAPDFETAIQQIQTHLEAVGTAWGRFLPDSGKPSQRTWQRVLMESRGLQERIEKAIEAISEGKRHKASAGIEIAIPDDSVRTIAGDVVLRNELTEESRTSGEWGTIFDWDAGRKTFNDKAKRGEIRVVRDEKSTDSFPRFFVIRDGIENRLLRSSKIARDEKLKSANKPGRGGSRKVKA